LSSGASVTLAHHNIQFNKRVLVSLGLTILLGIIFTGFQLFEYKTCVFTIRDRVFGATFFVATGFHGLHVIIGTLFLT
jgi:heme/copper-type cytochrome/quinol oxidase subunit 3